jgi:hypothetical protein
MNYWPDNRAINFLPDPPCERSRGLLMRAYCGDVDAEIYCGISAARSIVAIKHVRGALRGTCSDVFRAMIPQTNAFSLLVYLSTSKCALPTNADEYASALRRRAA